MLAAALLLSAGVVEGLFQITGRVARNSKRAGPVPLSRSQPSQ
jgi:hypothetical protein